MNKKSELIRRL